MNNFGEGNPVSKLYRQLVTKKHEIMHLIDVFIQNNTLSQNEKFYIDVLHFFQYKNAIH